MDAKIPKKMLGNRIQWYRERIVRHDPLELIPGGRGAWETRSAVRREGHDIRSQTVGTAAGSTTRWVCGLADPHRFHLTKGNTTYVTGLLWGLIWIKEPTVTVGGLWVHKDAKQFL